MTETQVKDTLNKYGLLSLYRVNTAEFTTRLNQQNVDLEQYLAYFINEIGPSKAVNSVESIDKYTSARTQEEKTLLKHIFNAYTTFQNVSNNLKDPSIAMDVLKEMIEPHVLYFMFSVAGLHNEASKYLAEAKNYHSMYKSAVDGLPEDFNTCKEELNGTT